MSIPARDHEITEPTDPEDPTDISDPTDSEPLPSTSYIPSIPSPTESSEVKSDVNQDLYNQIAKLKKENELLLKKNIDIKQKCEKYKKSSFYYKRKSINMECSLCELKTELKSLQAKFDLSTTQITTLNLCASEVPRELFESTAKRMTGTRDRSYHPALRKLAVSLHLCSPKAYRWILNLEFL